MALLLTDLPPAYRPLGVTISHARKAARLTQPELAQRLAISQSYLSLIEQGHRRPEPIVIQRIADVLDVPYRELAELAGYWPSREGDITLNVTPEEADDIMRYLDLPTELRRYAVEAARLAKRMWPIEQVPNRPPSSPTEQHDPAVDGRPTEEGDQEPDR
jgi:transcriptional regulator with XRE-family HTH domain